MVKKFSELGLNRLQAFEIYDKEQGITTTEFMTPAQIYKEEQKRVLVAARGTTGIPSREFKKRATAKGVVYAEEDALFNNRWRAKVKNILDKVDKAISEELEKLEQRTKAYKVTISANSDIDPATTKIPEMYWGEVSELKRSGSKEKRVIQVPALSTAAYNKREADILNSRPIKVRREMAGQHSGGKPLLILPPEYERLIKTKKNESGTLTRKKAEAKYLKDVEEALEVEPRLVKQARIRRERNEDIDLAEISILKTATGKWKKIVDVKDEVFRIANALRSRPNLGTGSTEKAIIYHRFLYSQLQEMFEQLALAQQRRIPESLRPESYEGKVMPEAWQKGRYWEVVRSDDLVSIDANSVMMRAVKDMFDAALKRKRTTDKVQRRGLLAGGNKFSNATPVQRWKYAYGVIIDKVQFYHLGNGDETYSLYTIYEVNNPFNPDAAISTYSTLQEAKRDWADPTLYTTREERAAGTVPTPAQTAREMADERIEELEAERAANEKAGVDVPVLNQEERNILQELRETYPDFESDPETLGYGLPRKKTKKVTAPGVLSPAEKSAIVKSFMNRVRFPLTRGISQVRAQRMRLGMDVPKGESTLTTQEVLEKSDEALVNVEYYDDKNQKLSDNQVRARVTSRGDDKLPQVTIIESDVPAAAPSARTAEQIDAEVKVLEDRLLEEFDIVATRPYGKRTLRDPKGRFKKKRGIKREVDKEGQPVKGSPFEVSQRLQSELNALYAERMTVPLDAKRTLKKPKAVDSSGKPLKRSDLARHSGWFSKR